MAEGSNWSDLTRRVASGILMAILALGLAWWGGWPFAIFWTAAAVLVLGEWMGIVTGGETPVPVLVVGGAAIVASVCVALLASPALAALLLAGAGLTVAGMRRGRPEALVAGAGVPYAGAMAIPVILLRGDHGLGLAAVLFVFAAVWGSDIMAYFTGRTFGGPKLWPSVSPKKTWSGFIGGTLCGAAAAAIVGVVAGAERPGVLFAVGLGLAILSQGGDLLELALKRRFGAKDAGKLIPGHGGLMDRLDGFVAAGLGALLLGLARNAADPAAGLLRW